MYTPSRLILISALAIYLVDSFVMGQGVIATLAAGLGLITAFLRVVVPLLSKKTMSLKPIVPAVILVFTAFLTLVTIKANNRMARERAIELVTVIEKYQAENGAYPAKLEDLVPKYLPSVPVPKFFVSFNHFNYSNENGRVTLMYVETPPFGRPVYDFTAHTWAYID